jgi:hypothetical protein
MQRLHIALEGLPNSGKSTLFRAGRLFFLYPIDNVKRGGIEQALF